VTSPGLYSSAVPGWSPRHDAPTFFVAVDLLKHALIRLYAKKPVLDGPTKPLYREFIRPTLSRQMSSTDPPHSSIVLYQTEDGRTRIQCRFEEETLWLTQAQIAELFEVTPQNVTLHLKAIFAEGELVEAATCKDYLQVRPEGGRDVSRRPVTTAWKPSSPWVIACGVIAGRNFASGRQRA